MMRTMNSKNCRDMPIPVDPDARFTWLQRRVEWCVLWDYRGAELINMMLVFLTGVWFITPEWKIFSTCPQVYLVMSTMTQGSEHPWGILFTLMGIVIGWALWNDHIHARKWLALACGGLWTIVSVSAGASDWHSPTFPVYVIFAFNMFRVFFCIHPDAVTVRVPLELFELNTGEDVQTPQSMREPIS